MTEVVGGQMTSSGNKELDSLLEEIKSIQSDRREAESSMVQLEADMTVKIV